VKEIIVFELYILNLKSAHSVNSIGGKKLVFIMEIFKFKDNVSNNDILQSLVKLFKCKYLTHLYIDLIP